MVEKGIHKDTGSQARCQRGTVRKRGRRAVPWGRVMGGDGDGRGRVMGGGGGMPESWPWRVAEALQSTVMDSIL